jgi:uncharacterized protein (TIGR03000 family)
MGGSAKGLTLSSTSGENILSFFHRQGDTEMSRGILRAIGILAGCLLVWGIAAGPLTPPLRAQAGGDQFVDFVVLVPADAILEIEGKRTTSTGEVRRFRTPPLAAGPTYSYTLSATSRGSSVTKDVHVGFGLDNRFDLRPEFPSSAEDIGYPAQSRPAGSAQPTTAAGGSPARGDPSQDRQVFSSKVVKRPTAASVPFRSQLGLPLHSLTTLGSRIDAARRAHDPVTLANCANELSTAEKISGKKASLTSSQLIAEAAQLAALKRQVAELQAVSRVADQVQEQSQVATILQQNLQLAQQQVNADKAAIQTNEEPTWQPRKFVVNNYTTDTIDIYINGMMKGTVPPGMQITCTIDHRWNPVTVTGYGDQDTDTYGPHYIWGRWNKYTWNIN